MSAAKKIKEEEVYTPQELAKKYKTSDQFWRDAAMNEDLKHIRVGRNYRFYLSEVEAWFKQRSK